MIRETIIKELLASVKYPGFSRDIISFGIVRKIIITEEEITLQIVISSSAPEIAHELKSKILTALQSLQTKINILIDIQNPVHQKNIQQTAHLKDVKYIVAIGSGKGGVGKSTIATNLAIGLSLENFSVGLCDLDLYGPSIPLMTDSNIQPDVTSNGDIIPIQQYNVKMISMGMLVKENAPVVLRGPMVSRYTQQFLNHVEWGKLDFLIIDLPPGTGDIQLTLVQSLTLTGAVIVTTPQEVSLIDVRKAINMFRSTNIKILGLIENMSYFMEYSGKKNYIFGYEGGKKEALKQGIPFLGSLPIDSSLSSSSDSGKPIVLFEKENPISQSIFSIICSLKASIFSMNSE